MENRRKNDELIKEYGGVLPCGGKGARLAGLTGPEVPKSLFPLHGKELIRYSIESLDPEIVNCLVFAIDHNGEIVKRWVEEAGLPHEFQFSEQGRPGVLDAIVSGAEKVEEESIIVCNTDEVRFGLNIESAVRFHESRGTLATMVVTTADHLHRHGAVTINRKGFVTHLDLKPEEFLNLPHRQGLVNAGLLIIEKEAIELFDIGHDKDWMGIIDPLCEAGQLSAYIDFEIEYFNVGTEEEYTEAELYLERAPEANE